MKNVSRVTAVIVLAVFFCGVAKSDTFTNRQTKEVLHGYATSQTAEGKTTVKTAEKGQIELNLAEWDTVYDRQGRSNKVAVLKQEDEIMLQIEEEAFEKDIAKFSDEGILFILLEIDTPGGRTDLAHKMCAAITKNSNCRVIAFVKGGQYGGAISAGAALALACNKIYMAPNTTIGAATAITISEKGPASLKDTYGEEVGEKFSSAWRGFLASLAEQNGRPPLIARAMVDKDIEVIEVNDLQKRLFIDPVNKKPNQVVVHTWNKKGSLVTLTAAEAVQCGIADKVINSRNDLLANLNASDANIVESRSMQDAKKEYERARNKTNDLLKSLDLSIKQLEQTKQRPVAMRMLRQIKEDFETTIKLAKKYPDLHLSVVKLEERLNTVEAVYKNAKMSTPKHSR